MSEGTAVDGKALREAVEKLVELEERKASIMEDIKVVKGAAKEAGVNMKALAVVVRERLKDTREEGETERADVETYHEMVGG